MPRHNQTVIFHHTVGWAGVPAAKGTTLGSPHKWLITGQNTNHQTRQGLTAFTAQTRGAGQISAVPAGAVPDGTRREERRGVSAGVYHEGKEKTVNTIIMVHCGLRVGGAAAQRLISFDRHATK